MNLRIYEERRRDREIREGKKDGIWSSPLGRQQSSSRKKAKRNFSQNQNLPRHLKRQCLQDTLFAEILYTGLRTCVEPLKGQCHKIFKIIFPMIYNFCIFVPVYLNLLLSQITEILRILVPCLFYDTSSSGYPI